MNTNLNTNIFNTKLYEMLCDDSSDNNEENECLITLEPLDDDYVEMSCKHKFNFAALFKEIFVQKKKMNKLEVERLKNYQVKCPYCRTVQNGLIPCSNKYPTFRANGINLPKSKCFMGHKCSKIIKTGKRAGEICNKPCIKEFCKMHSKTNDNDKTPPIRCVEILKTGKRKGERCNNKCKTEISKKLNICATHLRFKDKSIYNTNE